jgi:hypothetical protein
MNTLLCRLFRLHIDRKDTWHILGDCGSAAVDRTLPIAANQLNTPHKIANAAGMKLEDVYSQEWQVPESIRQANSPIFIRNCFFVPKAQPQVSQVVSGGQHHMRPGLRFGVVAGQDPHRNRLAVHNREDLVGSAEKPKCKTRTNCQVSIHEKRLTRLIGADTNLQRFLITDICGESNRAQDAHWQSDDCGYQFQSSAYGDTHYAEGEQEQPDYGIKHQRHERQRPAQDEQDAPEQKLCHRLNASRANRLYPIYEAGWAQVPKQPELRLFQCGKQR